MGTEISLKVIKSTQDSLGKFIKKPPLSEKLLRKPPFRFLHDIVTAIINQTGFFEGLFSDEELISDNVKDRETKIAFLQKLIHVVNIVTESSLSVRPSKIIAGQEPEKTNELLQQIGIALQANLSSAQAVEKVLANKTSLPSKPDKSSSKSTKSTKTDNVTKVEKTKKEPSRSEQIKENTNRTNDKIASRGKKTDVIKKQKPPDASSKKVKALSVAGGKNIQKEVLINNEIESKNKLNVLSSVDLLDSFGENLEQSEKENLVLGDHLIPLDDGDARLDSVENTSEAKTVFEDTTSKEEADEIKIIPNFRPPSRPASGRHRTALITSKETNLNVRNNISNGDPRNGSVQVFGEELENSATENDALQSKVESEPSSKQQEFVHNESQEKVIVPKIKSGKDSATVKSKPLVNAKSISVESRSDKDLSEHRSSLASIDTESKDGSGTGSAKRLRPPSVRPSSARPGAPRLRERNTDVIVTSSEPVMVGKVNVIVENYDNQQEDDEGSLVIMQNSLEDNATNGDDFGSKGVTATNVHGHLVQQILKTQQELVSDDLSKVEIEWEWGARREREASYKEVESIRNGLQALSRAANPLGKLMDHVQEDVEVMRQELAHWREERHTAAKALRHQQNLMEQHIQPLQAKLDQLERSIMEQMDLVHTVKSNIHRNSLKIKRLVDGGDGK